MKKNKEKDEIIFSLAVSDKNSEMVMKLEKIIEKEMVNKKFTKNVPFKN